MSELRFERMTFFIREATVEDAEAVSGLIQAAFAEYRDLPVAPGALNETVESVRESLTRGGTLLAFEKPLSVEDAQPVGTAHCEPKADHLYVGRVAVHPERRRQGIGRMLMQHAEEIAPRLGLTRIRLGTRVSMHSNVAFYEGLGYRVVQREPHPRGPDTILWFEKELL